MRASFLLVIAALLAAETRKLPAPYQSLVEQSHAAPAEFAADALLRIVESGKIPDRQAKQDLVEQAFRLAAVAKFPVRMHGIQGTLTDTRSGFLSAAYDLKLDALSLQSRSVRDMLPINAAKARELFAEIPHPALAARTCYDPLVYDVADYYQTLGVVADGAFTQPERKKEAHVTFLLDYLGQVSAAAELAPAARAIKSAGVSPQQREALWARFNGVLETLQPDDRSYAAAIKEIGQEMTAATQVSFERFKQKSAGCPDDARPGVTLDLSSGPVHAGSTPELERYWQSGPAKQLLQDGLRLRYNADGKLIPESARSSPEWQQRLSDYLAELADWNAAQEKSEADFYHQKSIIYESLVELIPAGAERDKIIHAFVDFIGNSSLAQQSPVEWFVEAYSMFERARNSGNGDAAKLLDAYQNSSSAVLAMYANEEKTFGSSQVPSWVMNSR